MPYKIPCPSCKSSIVFKATKCPYCTQDLISGWEQPDTWKLFRIGMLIGLLILPFIGLLGVIFDNNKEIMNSLKEGYFGDGWWIGWIVMPLGGGGFTLWIVTYRRS
jgi:hypothetical protein